MTERSSLTLAYRGEVAPVNFDPHRGRLAYSIDEVTELSGLGRTLIFQAIRDKRLLAVKCGRRTIIRREDLDAFLRALPAAGCGNDA